MGGESIRMKDYMIAEPIAVKAKCPKCGSIMIYQKLHDNFRAVWCTYVECDYYADLSPDERYNSIETLRDTVKKNVV